MLRNSLVLDLERILERLDCTTMPNDRRNRVRFCFLISFPLIVTYNFAVNYDVEPLVFY